MHFKCRSSLETRQWVWWDKNLRMLPVCLIKIRKINIDPIPMLKTGSEISSDHIFGFSQSAHIQSQNPKTERYQASLVCWETFWCPQSLRQLKGRNSACPLRLKNLLQHEAVEGHFIHWDQCWDVWSVKKKVNCKGVCQKNLNGCLKFSPYLPSGVIPLSMVYCSCQTYPSQDTNSNRILKLLLLNQLRVGREKEREL